MSLSFNQVFVSLLGLCVLTAFVINPKYTNRVRNLQAMLAPVASPTRRLAGSLHERFSRPPATDDRSLADIRAENQQLRPLPLTLRGQVEEMKLINAERRK